MQADIVKDSLQYLPAGCRGIRQNPALQEDSPLDFSMPCSLSHGCAASLFARPQTRFTVWRIAFASKAG